MAPSPDALLPAEPQLHLIGIVRLPPWIVHNFHSWVDGMLDRYCIAARRPRSLHNMHLGNPVANDKRANKSIAQHPCTIVTCLSQNDVHAALCAELVALRLEGKLTMLLEGEQPAMRFAVSPYPDDPKVQIVFNANSFPVDFVLLDSIGSDRANLAAAK